MKARIVNNRDEAVAEILAKPKTERTLAEHVYLLEIEVEGLHKRLAALETDPRYLVENSNDIV